MVGRPSGADVARIDKPHQFLGANPMGTVTVRRNADATCAQHVRVRRGCRSSKPTGLTGGRRGDLTGERGRLVGPDLHDRHKRPLSTTKRTSEDLTSPRVGGTRHDDSVKTVVHPKSQGLDTSGTNDGDLEGLTEGKRRRDSNSQAGKVPRPNADHNPRELGQRDTALAEQFVNALKNASPSVGSGEVLLADQPPAVNEAEARRGR